MWNVVTSLFYRNDEYYMSHAITAIALKGDYNKDLAKEYDLLGTTLGFDLTLFHIDHYYTAYWQKKLKVTEYLELYNVEYACFPSEAVVEVLMSKVATDTPPQYAIIVTEYFGGFGKQYANVFYGNQLASKEVTNINQALFFLGVVAKEGLDEFDTVGLNRYRSQPDYLEKYVDLVEELGV